MIVEYREAPQFWIFVRERDLVAPRITEVILPLQEREVFFRDTVVVNRTVVLQDRRFGVNPGIPPTYIAAANGRPIPSYEISPRVFAGTANLPGATVVRADDFRSRERVREIARESTFVRQTTNTVAPARKLPPLQPLGVNERGRLGALPPRAAQPGFTVTEQNRPEGSNAPAMPVPQPPTSQSPNRPAPSRQGAAPGQPLQQGREGRDGAQQRAAPGPGPAQRELQGNQGQRDQRNLREGRPVAPNAPGAAPGTSGAAPGTQRNEGPADVRGAEPRQDQRNLREGRPGAPSPNAPGPSTKGGVFHRPALPALMARRQAAASASCAIDRRREQLLPKSRAAANGQESKIRAREIRTSGAPSQRPSAVERGPSPGLEAPRSRAPAAEGPRPQSPTTTGAAPGGGRAVPGGGVRREEQR